ncbi:MAG: 16S rRNA (adenine(1518)-N(6)/adenine(1519)-N(6))-dimethyltransferase RsmA [Parachlamydia sp.]|nr:16S rRNA (adenine(1518)-N(6)/adenine(1519)-N(6))-dimethyltransferase RsmA [Parachlamydia sp.]
MSLYKPTELIAFLESLGIEPRKGLSQNFLIDGNIIRKIVAAAHVQPGDVVLEIGPGPGALTEALLAHGASVIAVEKDTVLARALERLQQDDRLSVHNADIMEFDAEPVLEPLLKGKRAKLIANLPYHLTTPILERFISKRSIFSHLVVMVQEEVARRMTAHPGNRIYGSLTLFLNYYSKPRYAFHVSNRCFYPVPKVDSAVVSLELKEPPAVADEARFFELTRTAFQQRRKMLRSSLRELYTPEAVMQALESIGKSPLARPEELSIDDFVTIFESL